MIKIITWRFRIEILPKILERLTAMCRWRDICELQGTAIARLSSEDSESKHSR